MRVFANDNELLIALKQGDNNAFNHVYSLFYRPLCYFAERLTGQHEIAEDVVAESFIKLLQKKPDFSNVKKLKSFLYTVTQNTCIDILRRNKKQSDPNFVLDDLP